MKITAFLLLLPCLPLLAQPAAPVAPGPSSAGDISNFVAGPAAPATTTTPPTDNGSKTATSVAQPVTTTPAATTTPTTQAAPNSALPDEILAADNNARITRHGDGYAYSFDDVPMGVVCSCLAKAFHWTVIYTGSDVLSFTGSGEVSDSKQLPYIIVNGTSLFVTGNGNALEICPNHRSEIPTTTLKEIATKAQE